MDPVEKERLVAELVIAIAPRAVPPSAAAYALARAAVSLVQDRDERDCRVLARMLGDLCRAFEPGQTAT